jgi:hypothetical protein
MVTSAGDDAHPELAVHGNTPVVLLLIGRRSASS